MLTERYSQVHAFTEKYLIDPNGIVYTFLDRNTYSPPDAATFIDSDLQRDAMDFHIDGFTQGEFAAYENCGMCTGAYLQASLINPSEENLHIARRCFQAISHIFELGKELEYGFFPKCYGARFSPQTSTDQVLYAMTALDCYYPYARESEKAKIRDMIPAMVNFWIKRQYCYTYYQQKDMPWPLERFPALLLLARQYSSNPVFAAEYERLLPLTRNPSCSRLEGKRNGEEPLSEYEKREHAYLLGQTADAFTMQTMQNLLLLRLDSSNPLADCWKKGIVTLWDEARLTIADDGKLYFRVLVDMDSGAVRKVGQGCPYHGKGAKMGWTTMVIRAALQSLSYLPDDTDVIAWCRDTLNKLTLKDLVYFEDSENFPPELAFKTRFLSGDAITNFLWSAELLFKQANNAKLTGELR